MDSLLSGAIISGGSSIIGGIVDLIKRKKQKKQIDKYQEGLDSWYQTQMATDYLDSAQAKSTLAVLNQKNKSELKNMDNNLIKGGYTDESKIGYAKAINENYSNSVAQLAGFDTDYKNKIASDYWNNSTELQKQRISLNSNSTGNGISLAGEAIGDYLIDMHKKNSEKKE